MVETVKSLDPITFQSGINIDLMKVVLKFDRQLEILCLDSGSAKDLGKCLIEFSEKLEAAAAIIDAGHLPEKILESKGPDNNEKSDEVRPEAGQPAGPETPAGGPGDCS